MVFLSLPPASPLPIMTLVIINISLISLRLYQIDFGVFVARLNYSQDVLSCNFLCTDIGRSWWGKCSISCLVVAYRVSQCSGKLKTAPVVTSVPSKPSGTIQYNTMQNTLETIAASSTQCITMKFTFERYSIMQTLQFKELYALLYQVELTRDKYTEFYIKGWCVICH